MAAAAAGVIFRAVSSASPAVASKLHSLTSSIAISSSSSPLLFGGGLFAASLNNNNNNNNNNLIRRRRRRDDWRWKVHASQRGYKKVRGSKKLELDVNIRLEQQLPHHPQILDIAETLRLNVPMAMKLAFDGLRDSDYKTRDPAIDDAGQYESVELSILLCNDDFICELNKDWRNSDVATDVLSMSQHVPELKLPMLMLGDIVISVETAARQAKERGHTLLDEIRILMVHGLLHLMGFDHELSDEAESEMENEEERLLKSLGWKGKGLIQSASTADDNNNPQPNTPTDG